MLSQWLDVIVVTVLTASANPDRAAVAWGTVTIGPTSEVKGRPETELTLNCGDGKTSGLVQYWHTPFGDLKRPGFVDPGPVLMRSDGTLVVSNCSRRHSGLYYCLLQGARGTTLWPYQVHVHPDHRGLEEVQVGFRSRRIIGSDEGDDGISQQDLAVAVVAAVLLTFVVGFSAGALSRTYVLRCLGSIRTRIRSPRQQSDQTDRSGVTMTTLHPWYSHEEAEPVDCNETMETTVSSITSSPPIKPQRSFKHRRDEEEETSAYLEGCGHIKEEEEGLEEEHQEEGTYGGLYLSGGDEEEEKEGDEEEEEERRREKDSQRSQEKEKGDEEDEERRENEETQRRQEEDTLGGFYVRGGDEEEERAEEEEEEEERRREEKDSQRRHEEEGTLGGFFVSGGDEEEGTKRKLEEKEGDEEKEEEERGEEKETKRRRQEEEEEVQHPHSEASSEGGDTKPEGPPEPQRRRSRVIRLYQYDEEGQRYCHLPDPAPDEPGPAPRLRQRSVSLTRLNAIMGAASAGPLDSEGDAGRRKETHFHMDI